MPDNTSSPTDGYLIAVIGPSGSGKDTILRGCMEAFSDDTDVHWVRRVITRDNDPSREDHDTVSVEQFKKMSDQGKFAVQWNAHELSYGVLAETHDHINNGKITIVNGSRAALPDFRAAFPRFKAVWITASNEVLAERLAARGTESADDIQQRLARIVPVTPAADDSIIDNSGQIDESVEQLINLIFELKPAVG